jgi:hypothetical protein
MSSETARGYFLLDKKAAIVPKAPPPSATCIMPEAGETAMLMIFLINSVLSTKI